MNGISVAMSFYTPGSERNIWTRMPQVPTVGDSLHYSLTGDPDDSMAWKVIHVSWVFENAEWHAEIGLS